MVTLDRRTFAVGISAAVGACAALPKPAREIAAASQTNIVVERYSSRMDQIIAKGVVPEIVADGIDWSEGPAWDQKRQRLYFSDGPQNRIYTWSRKDGLGLWRAESGSTTPSPAGVNSGTNGLLYVPEEDSLLVCDHPSRSILKYDLGKGGEGQVFVSGKPGNSFNSPNDLVLDKAGGLFFTDPPYGLEGAFDSSLRERSYQGVYYRAPNGEVTLIDDQLTAPNGIGLSPDGNTLYVAISDRSWPRLVRYLKTTAGWKRDGDSWFEMREMQAEDAPGNPDGMAITTDGTLFATDPGGVSIITPKGELLGRIRTRRATGNCTFGENGSVLFITADDLILRVPTRLKSLGFE